MKKLLLIIILIQTFPSFSQTSRFDSTVFSGIKQIYDIKFNDAEQTFNSLVKNYPDKPQGKFFLAMVDWWRIMLNPDNKSYDDAFISKLGDVINQCDNILKKHSDDIDALFF